MKARFSKAQLAYAVLGMVALMWLAGCAAPPPEFARKPFEIPVYPPPPEIPRFYWERTIYSTADVVEDAKDGALRRMMTGEGRSGEGLAKPYGVTVRNGRLYVGDTLERSVMMFDLNKKSFKRIGDDDPGALRMPFGMDLDAQGNLYVLDGQLKRIHVYDTNGKFLRMMAQDVQWSRPVGLTIDTARKRLYVVDIGGVDSQNHRVRALDLDTGKVLFDIGKRGDGAGELNLPRDAVVGADGLLYVVDSGNFRVQVFDPDGKFVKTFGAIGRQTGQFSRPKEIAADTQGNIYVADAAFGNFQIFNPEGALLLDVGSRSGSDAPAKFMLPAGIAVDLDGRIYMVDQYFRKVEVFRPAQLPATAAYGLPAASGQQPDRTTQRLPAAPGAVK